MSECALSANSKFRACLFAVLLPPFRDVCGCLAAEGRDFFPVAVLILVLFYCAHVEEQEDCAVHARRAPSRLQLVVAVIGKEAMQTFYFTIGHDMTSVPLLPKC